MFSVQDKASRLAAYSLGAGPGQFVIDVCSAPGGKAMAIAESMNNTGRIVCMDIHENRLGLVEEEAGRLGVTIIETMAWDARETKKEFVDSADLVLVDAPCSGLGTARRKPEVKYKAFDEKMETLPRTQADILRASACYVKQGGALVYSTCTISKRENTDVIDAFLKDRKDFVLADMVQLMPMNGKTDGFFICRLERAGDAIGE